MRLLITGGTGTLGQAIAKLMAAEYPAWEVGILSRGETLQEEMAARYPAMNYHIGDVRDAVRLRDVMRSYSHVIHCAALKCSHLGERDPGEFVETNIRGTQNVCRIARDFGYARAIVVSTDKAIEPVSCYGASKMAADRIALGTNTKVWDVCSVVRLGNIIGSRGSVVPFWRQCAQRGDPLPITDPEMTRFFISADDAARTVLWTMMRQRWDGGPEIVVRSCYAIGIRDLALLIADGVPVRYVGRRPGERLHESMMVDADGKFDVHDEYMMIRRGAANKCYRFSSNEVPSAALSKVRELLATA